MIKQALQVKLFMKMFGQDTNESPVDSVDMKTYNLRTSLGQEEQDEFSESFHVGDKSQMLVDKGEALDALCDRLYILFGDAHTLGLANLLPVGFRMVHESNMTKLWKTSEVDNLPDDFTAVRVNKGVDRQFLVRNALGKVIKSPSYQPANLRDLIDELSGQELLNYDHAAQIMFGEDAEEQEYNELAQKLGEEALANLSPPHFDLDNEA